MKDKNATEDQFLIREDGGRKTVILIRWILIIVVGYLVVFSVSAQSLVNNAECRDLGYSREELIGMNYRQYSDEATAKKSYELYSNITTVRLTFKDDL